MSLREADAFTAGEAFVAPPADPPKRRCATCRREKPLDAFAKHNRATDGRRKSCRVCVRNGRAISKPRSPEQIERAKVHAAQPARRERNRAAVADWNARHPQAARARQLLRRAVRKGQVSPPSVCQIEGCESTRVVGHHPDYGKPLSVLWCCGSCHRRLHLGVLLGLKADVPKGLRRIPREFRHAA